MSEAPTAHTLRDQLSGIVVGTLNNTREEACADFLLQNDAALARAMAQILWVRETISTPEHILGNELTKHGEIAEFLDVGIRNGRAILEGMEPPATFEGVGRTAMEDYFLDGQAIQSKFINGINNGLTHTLAHLDKYPEFGTAGGYVIPKDQFEMIIKIINGENVHELKSSTVDAIKNKVALIEAQTGRSFQEAVQPSVSNYADVQQGKVQETLDGHEEGFQQRNEERAEEITSEHAPSLTGMTQAAAIAGSVSAAITLGTALYGKAKEGKNVFRGDFTSEDWKDVGLASGKGFVGGAVAGGAIYALTNYAEMSAPFAGAIVSAAKGMASLSTDLAAGRISSDEFVDLGLIVCAEAAIVLLATVAGQTLIPIPILGGVIGSISGKMMVQFAEGLSAKSADQVRAEMAVYVDSLDETYRRVIAEINAEFDKLGNLTTIAFDPDRNHALVLSSSVDLALAYGVAQSQLLCSIADIDDFMTA